MRLATPFPRSLLAAGLIGGLALLAATQGEAADGDPAEPRPMVVCPVQGGVDASATRSDADTSRASREEAAAPARRIDWRAMLPAVTLRGRA